uniref:Deleted in lymphocytic leukemia 7 n=1 Tax=Sphenodon punctatus TaxID=8508 RepID=A0A8D0GQS2_SPHPU
MARRLPLLESIAHQHIALQTLQCLQQQWGAEGDPGACCSHCPMNHAGHIQELSRGNFGSAQHGTGWDQELSPLVKAGPRTIREIALHSTLSRVVDSTSRLLSVEQALLPPLLQEHPFSDPLKDSIEFRNICSHMALQTEERSFDTDLYAAHRCLKTIVEKLICSLAASPSYSHAAALASIREILQNLPDM